MKKPTPQDPLHLVRSLIHAGHIQSTRTALSSAALIGFTFDDMIALTVSLTMHNA